MPYLAPRIRRGLVLPLGLALGLGLAACGDDAGGPAGGETGGTGAATDPGKAPAPGRPTFDEARLAALQQTEIPGYTRSAGMLSEGRTVVHYVAEEKTADGGTLKAMVVFEPAGLVGSLDPDVYAGKEDLFRKAMDKTHADDPDLVWHYGALDLDADHRGVRQYVRSYVETHEGKMKHKLNTYSARYHDGTNGITIQLVVHGVSARSAEDLARNLDADRGDAVARELFAAFASAFG